MSFLATCFAIAFIFVVGRFLIRHLGFPRDLGGLVRWGIALLFGAVCLHAVAECLRSAGGMIPRRSFGEADVFEGLLFIALAIGGYFAWTRDRERQDARAECDERARQLPRRRALPPPPTELAQPGGFRPIDTAGAPREEE